MKKVSVIITTFNGSSRGFLKESIESVLNQTYKNFELFIVDDGSTDNTKLLCEKYLKDLRVTYLYKENGGISTARNLGIKNSSGDYICFLDDDDFWVPEKLEKQLNFFKKSMDPKIGLVHTWTEHVNATGKHIGFQKIKTSGNILQRLFEEDNVINATSSVMIKKEVFACAGIFKAHMLHVEDIELWFRVAKHFHVYSVNEPLVKYRIHNINKLSQCFDKDIVFLQLLNQYVLKENKQFDERVMHCKLYKKFAGKYFFSKKYPEFRRCCKLARVYGSLGFGNRMRYVGSFFPGVIEWVRKLKRG